MPCKSAVFLTSALVSASLVGNSLAADAGTLSRNGTSNAALSLALSCGGAHPSSVGVPSGNIGSGARIFAPVNGARA